MNSLKKLSISYPLVILVSLLIQGLGLLKSMYLSGSFGASQILDAYYLSNVFTISIFSIVGAAITTIVIPELNDTTPFYEKKKNIGRLY